MPFNCEYVKLESIFPNNDEKLKCGEIYIRSSGIISLACGFCEIGEFFTLDSYSEHFNCHFQAENQQTTNTKPELPKLQDIPIGSKLHDVADVNPEDPLQCDTFTSSPQLSIRDKDLQQDREENIIKDEKIFIISDSDVEIDEPNLSHGLPIHNGSSKRQPAKCNLCDEVFAVMPELREHWWKSHNIGYKCRFCEKQFYERSNRYYHENNHTSEPSQKERKRICEICNEWMPTNRALVQHKWRVHLVGAACRHCAKQFATPHSRNDHEKIHTGEPRQKKKRKRECYCKKPECPKHNRVTTPIRAPSKCDNCGEIFALMHDLRRHIWTAHKMGHKCRFCEKQFYASGNRNTHERMHTGQHPYKCPHCTRTFSSKTPMKHHIMLHENDRPFLCTTCGKRFINITQLNKHVRDKHPSNLGDQKDSYLCPLCNIGFARYYSLKKHKEKFHKIVVEILACDICQRVFNSRKCLVQHMKLHSGKKLYKCRYCEMAFAQLAGKRGHERNRHENIVV